MKPDFNKGGGLLPTVVQDNTTKAVLMVAWMNEESFHKTLETKETWFWSRSRQEGWYKWQCTTRGGYEARLRW
jgi:phosphoribosyl-AMP cyclohydrolase